MTRRKALQTCSSGLGYLAFSALAHQAAVASGSALSLRKPHFAAKAKRVIFLCMKGGPSHVDLFDHKPELIRRNGKPLSKDSKYGAKLLGPVHALTQHAKSGLRISELFPHLAKHADDLCVINSMNTDLPNHAPAFGQMHTGSFQFTRPSLGAWTLYGLGSENENLPGFISLNPPSDFGGAQNYGSAFLPSICQGTKIGGGQTPALYAAMTGRHEEPGPPMKNIEGQVSKEMQRAQIDLIQSMNRLKLKQEGYQPEIEGAIESLELAFRMQAEVPGTLDIQSEPEQIKKLYGIGNKGGDRFARQCLLARRLAESGVRFIEITAPVNWDHHFMLRDNLAKSCAATDQPIAGLLSDLKSRDMLKETLVVWAGEFGRTPYAQGADGRDHNNKGYSIWMAGGGLKGGMAYGSTDEIGQKAVINPVHIHDWHATILHLLGLDHKRLTYNYAGRDFRLTNVYGEVVKDIIA
jgi:hypothetical protein